MSVGLLYRYFPSKQAVVLTLYDELTSAFADRAAAMPAGSWCARFLFALRASLAALGPQRDTLAALVPVLVGDREQGLFAPETVFSRQRVQEVFAAAVSGANDAPAAPASESLGQLLYLAHLLVLLFWLLDRSTDQRATTGLVAMVERALPLFAAALRLPASSRLITGAAAFMRDGLFGERAEV